MRSRKSDSMELQRKSCLYLFFPIEKVTSLRSTILGVSPSLSPNELKRLYPKNKRYIPIRVSLIRKRRTPLRPKFCFVFFLIVFCIFDKCPNFNNLGFNSKFIVISLILIRSSRFFLFLFSSSAVYLVFVIILYWGWTGEGIRRENREKSLMFYSVLHPACWFLHPSTHQFSHPSTHRLICPSIHLSIHTCIHTSTHPPIYPSIHSSSHTWTQLTSVDHVLWTRQTRISPIKESRPSDKHL